MVRGRPILLPSHIFFSHHFFSPSSLVMFVLRWYWNEPDDTWYVDTALCTT